MNIECHDQISQSQIVICSECGGIGQTRSVVCDRRNRKPGTNLKEASPMREVFRRCHPCGGRGRLIAKIKFLHLNDIGYAYLSGQQKMARRWYESQGTSVDPVGKDDECDDIDEEDGFAPRHPPMKKGKKVTA